MLMFQSAIVFQSSIVLMSMSQNATKFQSNIALRFPTRNVIKPNITNLLSILISIAKKSIPTTQLSTSTTTKQFVRKLKSLIVKLITRKLVLTNKSSIVLHPTRLKQAMKIRKNVPPITRNIVNQATTTERNATKYQRRSVITSRYQNTIKYLKNIVAMSRSQNATKYQSSIAQKHISKNATKL